uniref:Uncharacterized protein n=1 Tax=Ciona savignyi TaxID=51511 RepID=H2ZLX9_CIOSA
MTRVYKVMDQIEDLYFHIQERSKSNFTGRHKVEHVSKKDYARTKEGRAFRDAVQRFCDTVSQPIEIQDENTLITEEDILIETDPMSLKRIELVAPEPPICPDHMMQIAPPPPLVVDP